jgi:hypothetical protein
MILAVMTTGRHAEDGERRKRSGEMHDMTIAEVVRQRESRFERAAERARLEREARPRRRRGRFSLGR